MRLTETQLKSILKVFSQHFLAEDKLWLFGSRVNDEIKGGDIDFYVETNYDNWSIAVEKQISFLIDLKKKIGDQKIDLIINLLKSNQNRPIYDEAKNTGIQLK